MKKTKSILTRILAFSLSLLMITGLSLTIISAREYDDVSKEHEFESQIDLLSDIGVILGTSENEFSPEDNVTREQMALLLYRFMMGGRNNSGKINGTKFNDLYDPTYNGAITWANSNGYIIGTSATTFEPREGITFQDAMTMVLRALGQTTLSMEAGYPWSYIGKGIKLGLDKSLEDVKYTKELSRAEVACVLYNALTAEYLVSKLVNNGTTVIVSTTVIEDIFKYSIEKAKIVATNAYAIGENTTTVKNGYVTLLKNNGEKMTVVFDELGLEGSPEEWLNREIRVIYSNKNVIGSTFLGKNVKAETVSILNGTHVMINGVKYKVVENLQNPLNTNSNELIFHMFSDSSSLVQIKNAVELKNNLGFFDMTLIYDDNNSDTASRAILKNVKFGRLEITKNKINIADGLTKDQLTGGIINEVKAENGDYVLYYFNKGNKHLEITKVLDVVEKGLITKITSSNAIIDGETYTLGKENSGVEPKDIYNALLSIGLGNETRVVVYGDVIVAVLGAEDSVKTDSAYLLALGQPVPVYASGALRYIMNVNINGVDKEIFVNQTSVNVGKIYRYTKNADNMYTLRDQSNSAFTQKGELPVIISSLSSELKISKINNAYFDINGTKFVTNSNTSILVNDGKGNLAFHKGEISTSIIAKAGANIVSVFKDEVGSVESLLFMYVDKGEIGESDATSVIAKVLALAGYEYSEGKYHTIYTVFNFTTGEKLNVKSLFSDLTVGKAYLTSADGRLSNKEAQLIKGVVTGYTSGTITVSGETYKLASDVSLVSIGNSNNITNVELEDLYMKNVEFAKISNAVNTVILAGEIEFTVKYDSATCKINAKANASLANMEIKLASAYLGGDAVNIANWEVNYNSADTSVSIFTCEKLEIGNYTVMLSVNGTLFNLTVEVK